MPDKADRKDCPRPSLGPPLRPGRLLNCGFSGEAQEEGKAHVDRVEFLSRDTAEHAIDTTLVYRADLVHERERALAQSAAARRERRIERSLACRAADRNDGDESETLIRRDVRVADDGARPGAALLVAIS